MKWSLKAKIVFWFVIIILIAIVIYGFLIFSVYRVNLRGENYFNALREHPGVEQTLIDRIRELDEHDWRKIPPPITILPSGLFMRVFYTITGGVLFIIIVSVSGGFILLMRMLNQINFITRNVREIDEKRLHTRLSLKGKDPISNMARTFDNMLDKIENSFNNQRQFIQNASHEINTPLTVIKTKIDLLKQKKDVTKKDYKSTVELINSEIMRLSRITEELLTLSELEENNSKIEFEEVDLKSILKRMLVVFENQINSKGLKLKIHFKGKFKIWGSKVRLEQLLFNLLDNAVKYSIGDRDLKISLKSIINKRSMELSVSNTSSIIKEEDLPHVFNRFYRSANSTDRKSFGLGLSISKKIVENHKGSIEVDYNKHRKEVTFKVYLPLFKKDKRTN